MLACSVTLTVGVVFYRNEIMGALYREATAYSGLVLANLMVSFVAVSCTYIYGALLNANGSLMKMNRIFIVAILMNIGLNVWLIPTQKAWGATVSTCLTQFFVAGAQIFLAKKELGLATDGGWALRLLGYVAVVALLGYEVSAIHYSLGWVFGFGLCLMSGAVLTLVFGLVSWRSIWFYLNK